MEQVLKDCVLKAIREVGLDTLKRSSMFLSNERLKSELKKTA
ncbi:conserved hypothetical protein [Agrobacterium fabacearum CFBP 5771]|nr:conserved hypothetical protein [Agrobacterium fabacearum CFBP 5771]